MKIKTLAGIAAVAALIATPAMAQATQQQFSGPQQRSADSTGAKKMKKMHQARADDSRAAYRDSQAAYREEPRSGFWPMDVAAGVVGGAAGVAGAAIGTAGAIATAPFTPFRGDSYAYYRDTSTMPNRGYIADGNGPICVPGSVMTINGQRMRCQ
jgi:hypothetical protein